ncbi:MAG TPA: S41 family peptidase [Candidatus Saccharibacteria bacterium]|nr:S41 family peptidase [Candidatus Saccharibacteria bacterium]
MEQGQAQYNKKRQTRKVSLFSTVFIGALLFVAGWSIGSDQFNISLLNNNRIQTENDTLPSKLDYQSVNDVYDIIRKNYDGELKIEDVMNGLKNGLATATGDPYTEYLSEKEANDFDGELNGAFSGIGAELSKENDLLVVVSPISGYPADKAGLMPKDVIAEINGDNTYDMTLTEAVEKIRGESGTEVELTILREDEDKQVISIKRENIKIPSVEWSMKEGNVGYIKISRFADDTADLTKQAASELKAKNATAIVLDLRGNPGGLLESSVEVSSIWLDKGQIVVEEKRGNTTVDVHKASGDNILGGLNTIVLIDEGSASASEIVAGALKDNNRAKLVGQDSYGKGSVQQLTPVSSGGLLKITVARWFTPNGRNIDKEGIAPDKRVNRGVKDIKANKDPQLDYAIDELQK